MPDALYSTVADALQEAGYLSDCPSSATVVTPLAEDLTSGGDPTNIISHRARWLPLLAAGGGWCLLSLGVIFGPVAKFFRPVGGAGGNAAQPCFWLYEPALERIDHYLWL